VETPSSPVDGGVVYGQQEVVVSEGCGECAWLVPLGDLEDQALMVISVVLVVLVLSDWVSVESPLVLFTDPAVAAYSGGGAGGADSTAAL
jgi:hypothetical protein